MRRAPGGSDETRPMPSGRAARPDAASSVALVASRYERSLRPGLGTTIAPRGRAAFRRSLLVLGALLVLLAAACGGEDDSAPTLSELEKRYICPTCHTTLELSNAPVADRMRAIIRERIAAGDSVSEIDAVLIDNFGEEVLASPPKKGFNLLVWVLPLAAMAIAVAAVAVALRRWSRTRPEDAPEQTASTNGGPPLDPELERRVDEELARFDG